MSNSTQAMRLSDEIKAARGKEYNSRKWSNIVDNLRMLANQYGGAEEGPYAVVRTSFHGGGVVSRHKTATRALERARREAVTDCTCGCADVVPVSELENLRDSHDTRSPYAPAL